MERIPKKKDLGANTKAADELNQFQNGHVNNLFDLNEDVYGETSDLATGRPIDNTGNDSIEEELTIVEPGSKDALPVLEEEDDAAAKWLRENDRH
jgi:hypothetical protein